MVDTTNTDTVARSGRLERQARILRIVNVPMRRILRLPFTTPLSRSLMLLSFTGRKSGRQFEQPVSYVEDGDILLTPGGGRWKLNLREGEAIRVRLRGHDVQLLPEFVRDLDEVVVLVERIVALNSRAAAFMPFVGSGGEVDLGRLEAGLEHGFAIIRWHRAE
jgi:hypothetical protein